MPPEPAPSTGGLDTLEYEMLTPIWEEALLARPGDTAVLAWLGHAYTRLGRLEDGLGIDLRLTAILPDDPVARYNLACSYALLGRVDEALDALRASLELGYRDMDHLREDPDLDPIRGDPRFGGLVGNP